MSKKSFTFSFSRFPFSKICFSKYKSVYPVSKDDELNKTLHNGLLCTSSIQENKKEEVCCDFFSFIFDVNYNKYIDEK
jgi:hypothetical protein